MLTITLMSIMLVAVTFFVLIKRKLCLDIVGYDFSMLPILQVFQR